MKHTSIVAATASDLAELRRLLDSETLPSQGVEPGPAVTFLVARTEDGTMLGGVGLEGRGPQALLRSLVVDKSSRGAGLGRQLVTAAELQARLNGVDSLYLLTTTAPEFFRRLGYLDTDRASVPTALQETDEFTTLCPASAACLMKRLG